MARQRDALQVAADEGAAGIDAGEHGILRRPEDAGRAEYARVLRILRAARLAHPLVQAMVTEAPVDELRCMIVVDDDDDDDITVVPTGEVVFCDDLELETFAGRRSDANVVTVDRWMSSRRVLLQEPVQVTRQELPLSARSTPARHHALVGPAPPGVLTHLQNIGRRYAEPAPVPRPALPSLCHSGIVGRTASFLYHLFTPTGEPRV